MERGKDGRREGRKEDGLMGGRTDGERERRTGGTTDGRTAEEMEGMSRTDGHVEQCRRRMDVWSDVRRMEERMDD